MSIFSRTLAVTGLALAVSLAAGCSYSQDEDTFASRPELPKTITLVDTVKGQAIWTMRIPVGEQLVIDYNGHHLSEMFTQPTTPGKQASWALYKLSDDPNSPFAEPLKQGTIDLNGDPIRARISFRKSEPMPSAMPAAKSMPPATQPATSQPAS